MIGHGALGIWMDVDDSRAEDFNAWYRGQHLPERLSVPGFLRGRRYEVVGTGPRFFTLYETADGAVLSSAAYVERLNNPTDWTRQSLPLIRRMVRNAYRRIAAAPANGAERHLVTTRIQPASGRGPTVRAWLGEEGAAALGAVAGVAGFSAWETETSGTSVTTEERRIVGGEVVAAPPFLALCEVAGLEAGTALREFWSAWQTNLAAETRVDVYALMYGLAWISG
jgi:hypothetical protein